MFLFEFLEIKHNTDRPATIEDIKENISFKGHTAWILVCSIMIASIGLNANSPAVVIGAMLISPLMGPILGIGLSLATNDVDVMKRSIINFSVMVALSLATAALYFWVTPLSEDTSELFARTRPDLRDVLIAFFGGLALVIARAKKGTMASVIFGVAIATALMPPLCTAGYGIAKLKLNFFLGALYLFVINTIFIALATFLVLRFLRVPMVKYANSAHRQRIARLIYASAILVMLPATYTFFRAFQESQFKSQGTAFVREKVASYSFPQDVIYFDRLTKIEYNRGKDPLIELVFMGDGELPAGIEQTWDDILTKGEQYPALKGVQLRIISGGADTETQKLVEDKMKLMTQLYESKSVEVTSKDQRIAALEQEVLRLSRNQKTNLPFTEVAEEARINFSALQSLSLAHTVRTDFQKSDSLLVFLVQWKNTLPARQLKEQKTRFQQWLPVRLKDQTIDIREVPKDFFHRTSQQ